MLLESKWLTRIWLVLLVLTLGHFLLAETGSATHGLVLLVCATISLKGRLVIDYLMGLSGCSRTARWTMLSYFYLIPPLIALAWLFPAWLADLTTL